MSARTASLAEVEMTVHFSQICRVGEHNRTGGWRAIARPWVGVCWSGMAKKSRMAKKNVTKGTKTKPKLLAGGNPQIAKGEGDAPVQAYIAAMPGWKRDAGRRIDALVTSTVPGVRKAVKWNSPFYGVEGRGWFLNFHVFTDYVKVAFFNGAALRPVPPGASRHKDVRYVDIREGQLDEAQMAEWIRQAAALPGWTP
jgi:hypothetical protein